jgi:hypothetical protein
MKPLSRKKLLPLLIAHYESVMGELTPRDWQETLRFNKINRGICYASNLLFDTNLYDAKWVKKECVLPSMWAEYPQDTNSLDKAKEYLQIRVDKMKKILASLTK